jgi:hypothetical protein
MRRNHIPFVAAVLILVVGSTTFAFEGGQVEFTIGTGISMPDGHFKEFANDGFRLNFGLGFYLSPSFIIGGEADLRSYAPSEEYLSFARYLGRDRSIDLSWSESRFAAFIKVLLGSEGSGLYFKGAVGSQNLTLKMTSDYRDDQKETISDLGASLAVGLQIRVSEGAAAFAECNFGGFTSDDKAELANSVQVGGGITFFLGD